MAKSCLVQAGHVNIENNCDASLRGGTGAVHERELTSVIAGMIAGPLKAKGIECVVADANANCNSSIVGRDWDAAIALHAQHAAPLNAFGVALGNPLEDGAATESAKLRQAVTDFYFEQCKPNLVEAFGGWENTIDESEYYLFNALSAKTPFCLIEMGNVNADYSGWIQQHPQQAAAGIVNGLLAYLGV